MSFKGKLQDTFISLKHADFRYFLSGQLISLMGTMVQNTALSWYVYKLTNSPFLLGLLGVFQYAPVLLMTLIGGVIVERHSKRKILIVTQFSYMVQAFILTLVVYSGESKYWILALLAAVNGSITSLDMPTRQSFFIEFVGKRDLPNAISLNSTVFNMSRIVGPAFAGIIMNKFGVLQCFLINAISFIPVIYGVFKIKAQGNPKKLSDRNSGIFKELKDGILYTVKKRTLISTFLVMGVVCTFAFNSNVIIPVFAKEVMNGGASEYSFLLSIMGMGSLFGAMFMANTGRRLKINHYLIINSVILGILQIITVFTSNYILISLMLLFIGFFGLTFLNKANSTLQFNTEDGYRGRVMSIYAFLNIGSTPLGNAFVGFIMEKFGGKFGFFSCGLSIILLIFFAVFLSRLKKEVNSEL